MWHISAAGPVKEIREIVAKARAPYDNTQIDRAKANILEELADWPTADVHVEARGHNDRDHRNLYIRISQPPRAAVGDRETP